MLYESNYTGSDMYTKSPIFNFLMSICRCKFQSLKLKISFAHYNKHFQSFKIFFIFKTSKRRGLHRLLRRPPIGCNCEVLYNKHAYFITKFSLRDIQQFVIKFSERECQIGIELFRKALHMSPFKY